jgi:hypothetical protein
MHFQRHANPLGVGMIIPKGGIGKDLWMGISSELVFSPSNFRCREFLFYFVACYRALFCLSGESQYRRL